MHQNAFLAAWPLGKFNTLHRHSSALGGRLWAHTQYYNQRCLSDFGSGLRQSFDPHFQTLSAVYGGELLKSYSRPHSEYHNVTIVDAFYVFN